MSITFSELTHQYVTTNVASYSPATTFTPSANALLLCFVSASSTETSETDPTSVVTNGSPVITFTKLAQPALFVSGLTTITTWAAVSDPAPSATQTLTVSGWGVNRTGVSICCIQATGADVSRGAAGAIIQGTAQNHAAAATGGTMTLNAAAMTDNRTVTFFEHIAAENSTQGANQTLSSTGSYSTPNRGAIGEWRSDAFDTGPTASWTTSAQWWGAAVEVAAAYPRVPPTITLQAVNRAGTY